MTSPAPRPEILTIKPYVGGEGSISGVARVIKLSSNEGAFGPPPRAQAAFAAMAGKMHRYPDGGCTALRQAIGVRFGLDPARIVCGAGSDDLIYQLCLAYGGDGTELMMTRHGFSIYRIAGTYAGCRIVEVPETALTADVDAMLAAVTPATRLVFLANPNNPTGSMLPVGEIRRLRGWAAGPRAAGAGRRLCRIRHAPGLRGRGRAGGCRGQHCDDPHLQQDFRARRAAAGLGLCAGRRDRCAEPCARTVQCQQCGAGGGYCRPGRGGLGGTVGDA